MKRILVQTAATVAVLALGGLVLAGTTGPNAIAQSNGAVGVAPGTAFRQTPAASAEACATSCGSERACLSWSWAAGSQIRRDRFSEPQITPGICAMSQTRTPPSIQGTWNPVSGLPAATTVAQQTVYAANASPLPASSGRAGGGYWEVQPLTRRQGGEAVTLTTDLSQAPVRSTQSATAPVVQAPVQRAAPAQSNPSPASPAGPGPAESSSARSNPASRAGSSQSRWSGLCAACYNSTDTAAAKLGAAAAAGAADCSAGCATANGCSASSAPKASAARAGRPARTDRRPAPNGCPASAGCAAAGCAPSNASSSARDC
jgi:hypothetical protein